MKKLAIIAVLAVASSVAHAAVIEFNEAGYSSGSIDGQNGWVSAGSGLTVDPTGAGSVSTTANNQNMTLTGAPINSAGSSQIFKVNFSFAGSGTLDTGSAYHASFGLTTATTGAAIGLAAASGHAQVEIQQIGQIGGDGTIRALSAGWSPQTSQINWGDNDVFSLVYTVNLGVDAAGSTYEYYLTNETLSETTTTKSEALGADVFAALSTGSGAYFYAQSKTLTSGGVSGMTINSVDVIPEPATLGLVALFGGGVLFIRRRFMI